MELTIRNGVEIWRMDEGAVTEDGLSIWIRAFVLVSCRNYLLNKAGSDRRIDAFGR